MSAWTQRRGHVPQDVPGGVPGSEPGSGALQYAVERDVIPRLLHMHAAAGPGHLPQAPPSIDADAVERFTAALLQGSELAQDQLNAHLASGVPVPRICLELMAPAARRLGELWCADGCDFVQVTMATGRLQRMLRDLPTGWSVDGGGLLAGHAVLMAPAPGEQHTLGLAMVADFFRVVGCQVVLESMPDGPAVVDLVSTQGFDMVGFSIGSERHAPALAALITDVRRHTLRPQLKVLVGGPLVTERPDVAASLGADAMAIDALQAILAANHMLTAQGRSR